MAASKQSESNNAKKSSSAKKLSERVVNPYTGRYQVIEGKNEIDLENKRQALYQKWDKEQAKEDAKREEEDQKLREQQEQENYIRNSQISASEKTKVEQARIKRLKQLHCYPTPTITTVESYVYAKASPEVKKRKVYFPYKEDYLAAEKIGWWKKLLHRIKEDWFSESFEHAEKAYQDAFKKAKEEQAESEREYARALREKEIPYRQTAGQMALYKEEAVFDYFFHALEADRFNLINATFKKRYFEPVNYSPRTKEISFGYKIPSLEELDLIESVSYNEKNDEFEYHNYSSSNQQQNAQEIAESILFRAIVVLFSSDEFHVLKSVALTAIIAYMDDAYGKEIHKPVMHVRMTREQFDQLGDLSKVNAHSLFTRELNVEIADGLYLKKDCEISAIGCNSEG